MTFPRIWVIPGNRPGDDAQVYALAEELALPFETRRLELNWRYWLSGGHYGVSADAVDRDLRKRTLVAPWPDLILLVGRTTVPVARWIREQSGGRTKLVMIGHPRVPYDVFDLVFTTRQYRIPDGDSVRLQPVAMSRYGKLPRLTSEEQAWLDALPRPHLLLMLGGTTRHWKLGAKRIAEIAAELASQAAQAGGSLIVLRSARTSDAVVDAVEQRLESAPGEWRVVRQNFPRFSTLLHDADQLYPTADSVSMISEAAITGKPVGIVPVEPRWTARLLLGRQIVDSNPSRDLRRFWTYLLDNRMVGTMDEPAASNTPNPVSDAAREVRALLEQAAGPLPA